MNSDTATAPLLKDELAYLCENLRAAGLPSCHGIEIEFQANKSISWALQKAAALDAGGGIPE